MAAPFILPKASYVGQGALNGLLLEIEKHRAKRVLLITQDDIKKAGLAERVCRELTAGKIEHDLYTEVEPEPGVANVEKAAAFVRDNNYDLIIGLGGGSVIDVAKTAAVLAKNNGTVVDYAGIDKIPAPGLPSIIIPTTAGTGAEVTMNAIFSFPEEKVKKGLVSRYLMPSAAIVDPLMTMTMPPSVTAATGMDALVHAVESFTALKATTHTEMYAECAIMKIASNLRTAVANGQDVQARTEMCWGSYFAGISLANAGVGAVHALAYPLGGQFRVPHGIANAILFPSVIEFNIIGNMDKFAHIADLMGENINGRSPREAAMLAVKAIRELSRDVNIPVSLREVGVEEGDIDALVEGTASQNRLLSNNPRAISPVDIKNIYQEAL